jgi:dTDP-4-amino-4,6-dideoxygalactose transaminase
MKNMKNPIPFNKPYLSGRELEYIEKAVSSGKISGDGIFTMLCHSFFESKYGFGKTLLTSSCTDALEMCAILMNIQAGDEVILPSYTFVSTANAFALRNAKLVFVDSMEGHPNMDVSAIEPLITERTRAIVAVHYAGHACDMDSIMQIADRYGLYVVEDAAQAIDAYYKGVPLGSIGHLAAFSFHETKNIIAGEGGMLVINDARFHSRAEIIREKGTNRSQFFRGEVDKYGWVDIGSSFLPSDIIAAYLYAQLECLDRIQERRVLLWNTYHEAFEQLHFSGCLKRPKVPSFSTNNAHAYYLICRSLEERTALIGYLKDAGIGAVFHYLSLHRSEFYQAKHDGRVLLNSDVYTDCLVRLPMYYELSLDEVGSIADAVRTFFETYR